MSDGFELASCPNQDCPDFKKVGLGNIATRGFYGKNHDRILLYCRTCGKRFAQTQGSPLFGAHLPAERVHQIIHHAAEGLGVRAIARLLGLPKSTVNLAILKVGEHCRKACLSLMKDLQMNEAQLDELWTFVKKKRLLAGAKSSAAKERPGSGQP